MNMLKKYELDGKLSYEYFYDYLKDVNELSSKLIEFVNFKDGLFFTFLCDDIKIDQLYQFKGGGVAKNVEHKMIGLIYKLIKIYQETSVIFDDFDDEFPEDSNLPLFLDYGFYYKKEIYHSMNKDTVSKDKLEKCFNISNIMWHFLCVLTKIRLNPENRELSDDIIENICLNAQLILVGAYDDESFVFWKRNDFMIGELLETDFVKQT